MTTSVQYTQNIQTHTHLLLCCKRCNACVVVCRYCASFPNTPPPKMKMPKTCDHITQKPNVILPTTEIRIAWVVVDEVVRR